MEAGMAAQKGTVERLRAQGRRYTVKTKSCALRQRDVVITAVRSLSVLRFADLLNCACLLVSITSSCHASNAKNRVIMITVVAQFAL